VKFETLRPALCDVYDKALITIQEAKILYDATLRLQAKIIVDLGTGQGGSLKVLVAGAQETGGHVYTVDWWIESKINKYDPIQFADTIDELDLASYYTQFVMHDLDYVKDCPKPIDLLFIDTSHEYEETKKELEGYFPLLSGKGEVYLHDTIDSGHEENINKAVLEFLRDWKQKNGLEFNKFKLERSFKTYNYEIVMTCQGMGRIYPSKTGPWF